MKRFYLLIFFSLFILSCRENPFADKYSADSARGVLKIGEAIQNGETVNQETWDQLFNTSGYKKYLATKRGDALSAMIKEAILIAYSPGRSAEADSLRILKPDANDYQTLMFQNIHALARRQEEAGRFMEETDFPGLLAKANRLVKNYLPKRAVKDDVTLNELYLICTIPDASVRDHSVLLDLNLAMDMSKEEMVEMLAHEFFHNYREATQEDAPGDSFWRVFDSFENEGIADLIDKGDHPEAMYARFGEATEALYLDKYRNAAGTLRALDSLLVIYQADPVDGEFGPAADELVFNGHPTGYHMTGLIREEGLEKELVQVFDSPAAFAALYNEAARRKNEKGGDEYILSQNMLDHLKTVEE